MHGIGKIFSLMGPSQASSIPPVELWKVRPPPLTTFYGDLAIAAARIRVGHHANIAFPRLGDTIEALRGLSDLMLIS